MASQDPLPSSAAMSPDKNKDAAAVDAKSATDPLDDSEAETEILSESRVQTPVKKRVIDHFDKSGDAINRNDSTMSSGVPEDGSKATKSPDFILGKRKADNEMLFETDGDAKRIKDGNATGLPKVKEDETATKAEGEVDDDSSTQLSPPPTWTEFKHETEPRFRKRKSTDAVLHSQADKLAEGPSSRAISHEPSARTRSPHRSHHKRSSSFHNNNNNNNSSNINNSSNSGNGEKRHKTRITSYEHDSMSPSLDSHPHPLRHSARSAHSPAASQMPRGVKLDRTGRTRLAKACDADNTDFATVAAILREHTEDLDKPDNAGNTPLQIAALKGKTEVVNALIKEGCDIRCMNLEGDTPLIDATENGHIEVIKLLIAAGVDPRIGNVRGLPPIQLIDENKDHADEIRKILANAVKEIMQKPMHNSSSPVPLSTTRSEKSDVLAPRRAKFAPNHLYIQPSKAKLTELSAIGSYEGVGFCLECGISPRNDDMEAAAAGGHAEVMDLLVAYGAAPDPRPSDVDNKTPMLTAIGRGHLGIIRFLLGLREFRADRRTLDRKFYHQIARDRRGPRWDEEYNILRSAAKSAGAVAHLSESDSELTDSAGARTGDDKAGGQDEHTPAPRRRKLMSGKAVADKAREAQRKAEAAQVHGKKDLTGKEKDVKDVAVVQIPKLDDSTKPTPKEDQHLESDTGTDKVKDNPSGVSQAGDLDVNMSGTETQPVLDQEATQQQSSGIDDNAIVTKVEVESPKKVDILKRPESGTGTTKMTDVEMAHVPDTSTDQTVVDERRGQADDESRRQAEAAQQEAESKRKLDELKRREDAERKQKEEEAEEEAKRKQEAEREAAEAQRKEEEEKRRIARQRKAEEMERERQAERERKEAERQAEERRKLIETQQKLEAEARRMAERKDYLASLPRALGKLLDLGTSIPRVRGRDADSIHIKPLSAWLPLHTVRLAEIDPACSATDQDELWIMNWQAAVLLGHDTLHQPRADGWETRECTREQREQMWLSAGLNDCLVKDANWEEAPAEQQRQCGLPLFDVGCASYGVDWSQAARESRDKFLALPDAECFWLRLKDFVAQTRPDVSPHLQGEAIWTSGRAHVDHIRDEQGAITARRRAGGGAGPQESVYLNGVCLKIG